MEIVLDNNSSVDVESLVKGILNGGLIMEYAYSETVGKINRG
jgi:hypothetical protein